MAAIALPPDAMYSTGFAKVEPVVEIAEAKPESDDQQVDSGVDEGEVSIMRRKKKPGRPVKILPVPEPAPDYTIQPIDDTPVTIMPVNPPHHHPHHPIYNPHGTTLDNVATHMLCNDWFLKNVRELVEQYKALKTDNAIQARQICTLERDVSNLKDQVNSITVERDEAVSDYDCERRDHERTRDDLRTVRIQLCDLTKDYQQNLTELKHTKAHLGEARRENSRLKVQVADKESRINDLEEKLRIANASEDAANDRVTELQLIIYELERRNASLEKTKDRAEHTARAAGDCVQDLKIKVEDLNRTIRRLTRGGGYRILEAENADEAVETEAGTQKSDPLFEPLSQPAVEPEQPVVEPEKPAVEPEQPVVEPEKPAVEPEQTESPATEE